MPLPLRESEDQRANGDGPVFKRSELAATAGRDFLIKEMDLLQSVFNKYEEWIFRSRTGLIIGVGALMSQLGTKNEAAATEIVLILPVLAWLIEGGIRWEHWYAYIQRHYAIREFLNTTNSKAAISLYDLQNQLMPTGPNPRWLKFRSCFLKPGISVFYGVTWLLGCAAFEVPEKIGTMF